MNDPARERPTTDQSLRRLVTGVDASGRSCLIEEGPLTLEAAGPAGIVAAAVASTSTAPPPPRPPGRAQTNDLGVAPGLVRWFVVEYAPNLKFPMHNTDTIDFDIVLEGSVELGLDDGAHVLQSGDLVVVTGVDHAWIAGPAGCRLSVMSVGTVPPTDARDDPNI